MQAQMIQWAGKPALKVAVVIQNVDFLNN